MVGDNEGVFVIPAEIADEVADEAVEMTAFEDFVTQRVMEGNSIIGLYPAHCRKKREIKWRGLECAYPVIRIFQMEIYLL